MAIYVKQVTVGRVRLPLCGKEVELLQHYRIGQYYKLIPTVPRGRGWGVGGGGRLGANIKMSSITRLGPDMGVILH